MADKRKTVLILGNGFDLAHGLPTKYSHFLDFCGRVESIWHYNLDGSKSVTEFQSERIDNWETDMSIKKAIVTAYENRKISKNDEGSYEVTSDDLVLTEIHDLLDDNIWYKYFTDIYIKNRMKGENWIDFESEIRFIIKEMDNHSLSLADHWGDVIKKAMGSYEGSTKLGIFKGKNWSDEYIQKKGWKSDYKPTMKDFRKKTFEDLERLTRALELYLDVFVVKIPINDRIPEILNLSPDFVINFNYTL